MMDFMNKLDLSYQKYQTNGNGRDDHYKRKLLFPMKDTVSFLSRNLYSKIKVLVCCGHCHPDFSSLVIKFLLIILNIKLYPR